MKFSWHDSHGTLLTSPLSHSFTWATSDVENSAGQVLRAATDEKTMEETECKLRTFFFFFFKVKHVEGDLWRPVLPPQFLTT